MISEIHFCHFNKKKGYCKKCDYFLSKNQILKHYEEKKFEKHKI